MISTADFNDLIYETFSMLSKDIKELIEYILNEPNLKIEDIEVLIRDILEKALSFIKTWFKSHYNIKDSIFRNFPVLDSLLYNKDGWTLHNSIKDHYDAYNKWRIKNNFINALLNIIATEIQRLPNTTFDTIVERANLFDFVIIFGEAACGERCAKHLGIYQIGIDRYELPPYHPSYSYVDDRGHLHFVPACKCKATYCNAEDLDEEELINMDYEDLEEWVD